MLLLTVQFFSLNTQYVVFKEILIEFLQIRLELEETYNPGKFQNSCRMTPEQVLTSFDNFLYLFSCQ